MDHGFYTSEELERKLAEMKIPQRREVLLCVDEMLAFMNSVCPIEERWKPGQRFIHAGEKSKPRRPANRA